MQSVGDSSAAKNVTSLDSTSKVLSIRPDDAGSQAVARARKLWLAVAIIAQVLVVAIMIAFIVVTAKIDDLGELYDYSSDRSTNPIFSKVALGVNSLGAPAYGFDRKYAFFPVSCATSGTPTRDQMLNYFSDKNKKGYRFVSENLWTNSARFGAVMIVCAVMKAFVSLVSLVRFIRKKFIPRYVDWLEIVDVLVSVASLVVSSTSLIFLLLNIPDEVYVVLFAPGSTVDCSAHSAPDSKSRFIELLVPSRQFKFLGSAAGVVMAIVVLTGAFRWYSERVAVRYLVSQNEKLTLTERFWYLVTFSFCPAVPKSADSNKVDSSTHLEQPSSFDKI